MIAKVVNPDNPWVQSASGRAVSLITPQISDIDILDIAEGLSKQCRYNGQMGTFYSVAQHSVYVMRQMPIELRPYGLLHDAHEAYMGDITQPVKRAFRELGGIRTLNKIERNLDEAIYKSMGLDFPIPNDIKDLIHAADRRLLATEKRDLLRPRDWAVELPEPLKFNITPWPWPKALEEFMTAVRDCMVMNPKMAKSPAINHLTHGEHLL